MNLKRLAALSRTMHASGGATANEKAIAERLYRRALGGLLADWYQDQGSEPVSGEEIQERYEDWIDGRPVVKVLEQCPKLVEGYRLRSRVERGERLWFVERTFETAWSRAREDLKNPNRKQDRYGPEPVKE